VNSTAIIEGLLSDPWMTKAIMMACVIEGESQKTTLISPLMGEILFPPGI